MRRMERAKELFECERWVQLAGARHFFRELVGSMSPRATPAISLATVGRWRWALGWRSGVGAVQTALRGVLGVALHLE
jgi:hypothetical protein